MALTAPLGCLTVSNSVSIHIIWGHSTYSKLNRDSEEVDTPKGLANFIAAGDTWKVNKGGLNDALLALGCVRSCQRGFSIRGREQHILIIDSAILNPANAIERVAEPPPFLAATTSSPPNWIPGYQNTYFRPVRFFSFTEDQGQLTVNKPIELVGRDFASWSGQRQQRDNSLS